MADRPTPAQLYNLRATELLISLCEYSRGCLTAATEALERELVSERDYNALVLEMATALTSPVPFLLGHCAPGPDRQNMARIILQQLQMGLDSYCSDENFTIKLNFEIVPRVLN